MGILNLHGPSQVEAYREHHENVVSIEEDNLGIGYSRRFIQDYADRNNVPISWILDDDFISLHRIPDRKNVPTENGGAALLSEAEDAVLTEEFLNLTPPVGAAHFDFFMPADIARNPKSFSFVKVPVMGLLVIWDRVREAKAEYDWQLTIREDVDFAFQLFKAGFTTAQFNRFAMKVEPGTCNYTNANYLQMSQRMTEKWPDWCKIVANDKTYPGTEKIPAENRVKLKQNHHAWKKHLGV